MLIPKKIRNQIYAYLFKEGVLVTKKDFRCKHQETDTPNLYVIKLMTSLVSRKYVRESFTWNHYYWYLENEGIDYLREFLHLTEDVVPATLKKKTPAPGDRPQRDGPRGAGRGERRPGGYGDAKDVAPGSDYRPSFSGRPAAPRKPVEGQ